MSMPTVDPLCVTATYLTESSVPDMIRLAVLCSVEVLASAVKIIDASPVPEILLADNHDSRPEIVQSVFEVILNVAVLLASAPMESDAGVILNIMELPFLL